MKKTLTIAFAIITILILSTSVFASSVAKSETTMKLVKDEKANISFGKYGSFEKKMVNIDTDKKTIDISLTAANNQEKPGTRTETETIMDVGEVIYLIDGSKSMLDERVINEVNTTRQAVVLKAAEDLTKKLIDVNPDIKFGVVEFATSTDTTKEGTNEDAKTITPSLVSSLDEVKNAFTSVTTNTMGVRTDLEVGLDAAEKLANTGTHENKYIIILTDAIPNTSLGVVAGQDGKAYDDNVFTPTKNKLTSIKNNGINLISMLIDMNDDEIDISTKTPKPTYKQTAELIFGTSSAPTAGSVFYTSDETATSTITDSIYKALSKTVEREVPDGTEYVLTDIVIKDYFPKNIIDNFNFSYLTKPEKGEVSAKVDTSDNSITWTIAELKPGESATFTYRLSLKDSVDSSIIDINLPTNKDVTIDYKENGVQGKQVHSDKCPVVKLTVEETPTEDNTVAKVKIPQTGSNNFTIVGLIIASAVIGTISFINYRKTK